MYVCLILCAHFVLFSVKPSYSFVDYIRGGCEINLIVAIDFTVSSNIVTLYMQDCVLL